MSTYFGNLDRTHTVDYDDETYAIVAYIGDMLMLASPYVDNFWIHSSLVMYNGKQNPPSIPSRGY